MRLDFPEYEAVKSIAVNFDGNFDSIPVGTRFYRTGILENTNTDALGDPDTDCVVEKFILADTGKIIWYLHLDNDNPIDFFSDAPTKTSQGVERRILGWFRRVG